MGGLGGREDRALQFRNRTMAAGWTQVSNLLLHDPSIPPAEKVLYALLCSFAWESGECFPGQDRLAMSLGYSERQVVSLLQRLAERRLITIVRRGQGKTNIYIIEEPGQSGSEPGKASHAADMNWTSLLEVKQSSLQKSEISGRQAGIMTRRTGLQEDTVEEDTDQEDNNTIATTQGDGVVVSLAQGLERKAARRCAAIYREKTGLDDVSPATWVDWIRRFSVDAVIAKTMMLDNRVKRPAAWLAKALERDWRPAEQRIRPSSADNLPDLSRQHDVWRAEVEADKEGNGRNVTATE